MNTRMLGLFAVVGSALGAWWWTTQRRSRTLQVRTSARDHGTVIFDNTPTANDVDAIV
jgi:hypothetical protein